MRKHNNSINHELNSFKLKPKYEQKYVQYLKKRYGDKRAKSFSKSVSS